MRRKVIILLGTLIAAVLLSNTLFTINDIPREKLLSRLIMRGLEELHYNNTKIDDSFSEKAFDEFLKFQDINKRFLIKEDVEKLKSFKDKIDDEISSGTTEMMTATTALLQKRLKQVMGFYEETLAKPFDFTKDEFMEFDADKRTYCSDLAELKELWRKTLKYQTMIRYINLLKTKKKEKSKKELEETARKAVKKSYKRIFDRLLQGNERDALSRYLNAVINTYDPHSTYFAPKEKQDFDMEMSGTFEGIGALLTEKDGYVSIAEIIPGGPSWKQKELQPGDLILKVGQGEEEPVDIVGMRVEDAVKLIRGKKDTVVKLTVKKTDGQITIIAIKRDVVVIEETFAKSAVLIPEKMGRTFGYIHLPKFYNDFSKVDGRTSTGDVKKEIESLKKKNVEGIILDLRTNSGGALMDAIRMSGLFIPQGPVVQVKDKKNGARTYSDPDPGISYDGPLIVLINTLSASASEILTAALQDYNRAVIIGGHQSFGKGTVQVMLNLDQQLMRRPPDLKSLGALTVTIQKFYRITGTAIQLKGVTPDISLPDRFDFLEFGERYYDNHLEWDTIEPVSFKKWTEKPLDTTILAKKSKERVHKNKRFLEVEAYIEKLKEMRSDTLQSLNLVQVMAEQKAIKKETEKFNKSQEKEFAVKVLPPREFNAKTEPRLLEEQKVRQKEWLNKIKKDLILNESLAILNDLADLLKDTQK